MATPDDLETRDLYFGPWGREHAPDANVRDLGMALGATGRIEPRRGDPDLFEREAFMTAVEGGVMVWASELLGGLSLTQWHDAFGAGGYEPAIADRFIRRLLAKIKDGRDLGARATGG